MVAISTSTQIVLKEMNAAAGRLREKSPNHELLRYLKDHNLNDEFVQRFGADEDRFSNYLEKLLEALGEWPPAKT